MQASRTLTRDFERDRLPLSFLAAILISSGLALGIGRLIPSPEPLPPPMPVRVALVQLPGPPPPPPVAAAPDPLPPLQPQATPRHPNGTLTAPPPPLHPVRDIRRERRASPRHRAPVVAHRERAPPPTSPPATNPPETARPPQPPAGEPAARETLIGRIKRAIQSAFRYPEAARDMGAHGTVLVGFLYRDRSISNIHVLHSSASPTLDRAAVEIVRAADPPPAGRLAGQTLSLETPVVFDIVADGD